MYVATASLKLPKSVTMAGKTGVQTATARLYARSAVGTHRSAVTGVLTRVRNAMMALTMERHSQNATPIVTGSHSHPRNANAKPAIRIHFSTSAPSQPPVSLLLLATTIALAEQAIEQIA